MGQAVDSNATLGNTDLTYSLGFWAGASLPLGLGLCLLITGLFFAAPMNRMGLLSLPDFYRIKYGRGVELASSVLMISASASCSPATWSRTASSASASSALPHGAGRHPVRAGGALGRTDLRWPAARRTRAVCPPRRVRAGGAHDPGALGDHRRFLLHSQRGDPRHGFGRGAQLRGIEPRAEDKSVPDPLLRLVRITMLPVVGIAIFFAIAVPQTGILLTLAFDLMLAGLIVPFVLGHFWSRITTAAAAAAIGAGVVVRILLFALTPTMYGVENTVLYVPNDVFGPGFDGWPTFIAPLVSLVAFVAVALLSGRKDAPAADLPEPRTAPAETPQPATEG